MSDERPEMTPQELDELASAYLDGEASTEEAALVEGDPRLQAVVEELRAGRDLVAAPVDLPSDEVRDQMIAQALDHRAPVISLERARRRLRSVPPQARVILAAAAVVAAIALVGVTVFEQASRDDDMLADDSASAPAMADEAVIEMSEMPAAPEPQDAEIAEESFAAADSADDAVVEAPAEEMAAEMMADEMMESEMVMETSGDALQMFATEADLFTYLGEFVADSVAEGPEETADPIDLTGCPQPLDEEFELVIRFDAVVGDLEVVVTVYESDGELLVSQTTPPPECAPVKPLTPLP